MIKHLITEISEEDFRKLNLAVYRQEKEKNMDGSICFVMKEYNINDILSKEIAMTLNSGYESDLRDLKMPVTIAIHEEPTEEDFLRVKKEHPWLLEKASKNAVLYEYSYLDKFMNQFTGAQTFQIGWGIKHLYSTRDYYEAHEDYWRVRKNETKAIYRIKLSEKLLKAFILKHFSVKVKTISPNQWIETSYDLNECGTYTSKHSVLVTKKERSASYEPTDLIEATEDQLKAKLEEIKR